MNAAETYAELCASSSGDGLGLTTAPISFDVVELLRRCSPDLEVSQNDFHVSSVLKLLNGGFAPFVRRLTLNTLPRDQRSELIRFLTSNTQLEVLDLTKTRLGDAGVLEVILSLRNHDHPLRKLILADVGLSSKGAKNITADILRASRLELLDVQNNRLQASGVAAVRNACEAAGVEVELEGNLCVVEALNAATHGVGAVIAIAGAVFMTRRAVLRSVPKKVLGSLVVFVMSVFAMLTCSCAYHASHRRKQLNKTLRQADHCGVFLLIAGSYTPFCMAYALDTVAGKIVLILVWVLAIIGVAFSTGHLKTSSTGRTLFALAMGWIGVIPAQIIFQRMHAEAVALVFKGGLSYSTGIIFYFLGRKKWPIAHTIWHCWVLAGASFHFAALWRFVLAAPPTSVL